MTEFTRRATAEKWAKKHCDPLIDDLHPKEILALRRYKDQYARQINAALREAKGIAPEPDGNSNPEWNIIRYIDGAMAKCVLPISKKLVVYRGHHLQSAGVTAFDAGYFSGSYVEDHAFWSTSLLREEATAFCEQYKGLLGFGQQGDESLLMILHLTPGMSGIYMDCRRINDMYQCEILLPRRISVEVLEYGREAAGRRWMRGEVRAR